MGSRGLLPNINSYGVNPIGDFQVTLKAKTTSGSLTTQYFMCEVIIFIKIISISLLNDSYPNINM